MNVKIYVEGGGDSPDTIKRCKQGFSEYCNKLSQPSRRPAIVACGSRNETFDRFRTAVTHGKPGEKFALLVDSEGPVANGVTAPSYLGIRERWDFTGLPPQGVFLMVQAMEAWLLADRATLAAHYGQGFRLNSLPYTERTIEEIPKDDLEPSLKNASAGTRSKGQYHKTRHAFALLAKIDPAKVGAGSAHAAAFNEFVRNL